jgi:hypothetical protein
VAYRNGSYKHIDFEKTSTGRLVIGMFAGAMGVDDRIVGSFSAGDYLKINIDEVRNYDVSHSFTPNKY